jgi:hypothetical protein
VGHIYQRGDRCWISYRDAKTGKRVRKSAGGTRLEALIELRRIEGTPDGVPCELLMSDYLERCAAYLKPATLTQYRWSTQRLLDFFGGRDAEALKHRVPAILSPDEATKLLENAEEPAFGIFLIAPYLGPRPHLLSELDITAILGRSEDAASLPSPSLASRGSHAGF